MTNTTATRGQRFFASWYPSVMGKSESAGQGDMRREQLAQATGRTLEIGAGNGFSVPYYTDQVETLTLIEPNPEFRHQLAAQTAPTGPTTVDADGKTGAVAPGAPVALISAPEIGLSQVVVEGTASGDLLAGPGHRRDTVLPGQEGTSLVYGRATTYGGPFGKVGDLRKGDHVTVVVGQGRLAFTVLGLRRDGDPLPPAPAAGKARLVLTTAEGLRYGMGPGRAVYVDAEAPKAFPAPTGRPAAVPEPELAMQTDSGAMPLLVLCLAGLVAVTLGVIAARQRWSAALVWVVATPVVIALSWGTTDVVMRLLPNLI